MHTALAALSLPIESGFFLAAVCAFLAWLALSTLVLARRVLYDLMVAAVHRGGGSNPVLRRTAFHLAADADADAGVAARLAKQIVREDAPRLLHWAGERRGHRHWRQVEAMRVLARAGHSELVEALERMLADDDAEVASAAATILHDIPNDAATSVLIRRLQRGTSSPAWIAAQLEGRDVPVELLQPLLSAPEPAVRVWATRLVADSSVCSHSLEQELIRLCRNADADVRAAAAEALSMVGGSEEAAEQVAVLVSDPVWYVQIHAARALGRLGRIEHATKIAELLAHPKWWVRAAAKEALESLGPAVADDLFPLLDHPDPFARNGAAEVLQNLGVVDRLLLNVAEPSDLRWAESALLLRRILRAGGPRLTRASLEGLDTQPDHVTGPVVEPVGAA